jgi:hypothetical protein
MIDERTVDLSKWLAEKTPGYTGYGSTRRAADAPIVFGVEAMMYKGMKYGFTNGTGGSTFNGNLDFTLLLQTNGGYTTELDRFRLTCLRVPAFPGAQGFGKWSQGGRGGEVYIVENRNASGTGSLTNGMASRVRIKDAAGLDTNRLLPRTIVFREGGEINLAPNGIVSAEGGSLTPAGQSAPGSGIALRNGELRFGKGYTKNSQGIKVLSAPEVFRRAADFIVRYIRVRRTSVGVTEASPTIFPDNPDACAINASTRVILDHCSFAWGADGSLDVNVLEKSQLASGAPGPLPNEQPEMDITAQWCLVNQTLSDHSKGLLFRGKYGSRYSLLGCFLSNNADRNPVFGHLGDAVATDTTGCLFEAVNNIIYNWSYDNAGTMNQGSSAVRLQFLSNYYKKGPNSPTFTNSAFEILGNPKVRFESNEWNGTLWSNWHQYVEGHGLATPMPSRFTSEIATFNTASNSVGYLSLHSGASRGRDAVDTAYINDVLASGTSGNSAGGIVKNVPTALWAVTTPSASGPMDTDADGMADAWELRYDGSAMLPWKDVTAKSPNLLF